MPSYVPCVCLFFVAVSTAIPIPSLSNLASGINMYATQIDGDPQQGRDPALSNLPVFNFTGIQTENRTWNGVYDVPDAVFFRPSPSCSYTSEVSTLRSSVGFLQSLHEYSKTTETFLFWTHTDDREFQETSQQTFDSSFVLVKAKASCSAYQAAINAGGLTPKDLSLDFTADVLALLPTQYSPAAFPSLRQFVDRWGTHYLSSTVMGGSATIITTFTQENYTMLEHESTNMPIAAGLAFLAAFGDQSLTQDKNYDSYAAFTAAAASTSVMYVGPRPPAAAPDAHINASAWASDILLPGGAPEVTSYTSTPLASLVSRPDLFPGSPPGDAAARGASLQRFILQDYCTFAAVPCAEFSRNSAWSTAPASLPTPLRSTAVVGDGQGLVYAVGGAITGAPSSIVSATLLYNHSSGTSVLLPPAFYTGNASSQGGLAGAAAALNATTTTTTSSSGDGGLWVVGGINSAGVPQTGIARMDPVSRTWRVQGGLATARSGHCAVVVGGSLYVMGGVDGKGALLGDLEIYTASAGQTEPGKPLPAATAFSACIVQGGEVWLLGGVTATGVTAAVYIYTPLSDAWRPAPSAMLEPRAYHSVTALGADLLVITGGAGDASNTPTPSVLAFNTSSGELGGWFYAPPLPNPVLAQSSAASVYEPHSDARVPMEGPDNGGWVLVLIGGAPTPSTDPSAIASSSLQRLKVYDTHGSVRFVPPTVQALAALKSQHPLSAEQQWNELRSKGKAGPGKKAQALVATGASAAVLVDAALPIFPFVEFLSHSYNPILATPGAQRDAGWLAASPFQVACPSCFTEGKTVDGLTSVPNGVTVREINAVECAYSASAVTLRTAAQASASMSLFAQLNAGLFNLGSLLSVAFSVGAGGSLTISATADSSVSATASTARCTLFEASLDAYDFVPTFSPAFTAAVAALPDTLLDPQPWADFVNTWGVAFATRMSMGGTATQINLLEEAQFSQYIQIDASVESKASIKEWLSFSESVAVNYTSCSPLCPPVANNTRTDASSWRTAVASQPVPISMSLAPLWLLLDNNASQFYTGGGSSSSSSHAAFFSSIPSLVTWALERGDASTAQRIRGAADNLFQFVTSGAYCATVSGCAPMGGKPLWERPTTAPARTLPRNGLGSVGGLLNNRTIVIAGGSTASDGSGASASTLMFDTLHPASGWLEAQPAPTPCAFAAGFVLATPSASQPGTELWVIGGVPTGATPSTPASAAVNAFTLSSQGGVWSARPPLPVPLAHAAAVSMLPPPGVGTPGSPMVLVFGGCPTLALSTPCTSASDSIFLLDTGKGAGATWGTSTHTLPTGPSWGLSAVALPETGNVYVAGGRATYAMQGTPYLYVYSLLSDNWLLLESTAAPYPFYSASALLMANGKLMFIGGVTSDPAVQGGASTSALVWTYDAASKQWEKWDSAPWPVHSGVAVWLPGGPPGAGGVSGGGGDIFAAINASLPALFLVGGGNDTAALNSVAQLRNIL